MLVLQRKRLEIIDIIAPDKTRLVIMVTDIRGDKVRLGVEAPREWAVHRREVTESIERANKPEARHDD